MSALNVSARRQTSRQQGVVLVVALVMLVVIGLASVAVMRNVMNNDLVSENTRRQGQAMQAAQAALRYCEGLISTGHLKPYAPRTEATERWRTFQNWQIEGNAIQVGRTTVEAGFLNNSTINRYADNGSAAPRPECMAEERSVSPSKVVIVVTARGFSDDYAANTVGETQSGAVVWLQSILQMGS